VVAAGVSGKRILVKDVSTLTLWAIDQGEGEAARTRNSYSVNLQPPLIIPIP
jgi:hypothetical protein